MGIDLKPTIRTLPDQRVLYAREKGIIGTDFSEAASRAFARLMGFLDQRGMAGQWEYCLAITPDDPGVVQPEECRYDAGVILREGEQLALHPGDSVAYQTLPAGRWAVFRHTGPYSNLGPAWRAIYSEWAPHSGADLRDAPPYEVYLDVPGTPPEQLRTDIYVPIV